MREAYLQGQIDEIRGNELVRRRDLAPPSEGLLRDIVDEIDGGADLERPNSGIVSDAYDQVMRGRR